MPMASGDAGAAPDIITSWQPMALSNVVGTLGLTEKEYADELGFSSFSMGGGSGTVQSYEGPGEPNIAWCSGLNLAGVVLRVAKLKGTPDAAAGSVFLERRLQGAGGLDLRQ